ncbi:MAG TPA: DNA-binding domain-containing protein [Povalibacter sp.]|uniref:DNA-binding domain-containing protein n=1 Tax=Povalibacter sp. TaxID=1962978 RepID=UPI002B59CFED|nr:DNA-binding domain-containing protein [Povalibacter sp.]HMN46945.1 DNA-binding domain-containing protein [Povalibacter sp.]
MDLAQLQRAFQKHVLDGDDAIAVAVSRTEAVESAARLAVYADAYRLRLIEALAHNYPRLQQLLGDAAFGSIAREYLLAHPSASASVRWFGDRLAEFLAAACPDPPVLAELAHWEWAIAAAFDAADAEPLAEQALSSIEPAQWATLRLPLHPSVQLLRMNTNAPAIFKSLAADDEPPTPATLPTPHHWCVWREALTPRYRSVPEDEAAALQTLLAAGTFEALCDSLCEWHAAADVPARAVILLKGWIRDSMIVADRAISVGQASA